MLLSETLLLGGANVGRETERSIHLSNTSKCQTSTLTFTQPSEGDIGIPVIKGGIRGSERLSYLPKATQLGRGRELGLMFGDPVSATPGSICKHLVGHRGGKAIPRPLVCTNQVSH